VLLRSIAVMGTWQATKASVPIVAKVALSILVYCLAVALVPIVNKEIFSGDTSGQPKFPYPCATAFLQLGSVALVLSSLNVLGHFVRCGGSNTEASWLFGPHFLYKLRHVAPVGILFGLKYGITNWGLQLMPTDKHLLLQSTDMIWTVAAARVLSICPHCYRPLARS